MSKRYIDCAEILCLSKYNMYLEINLYYQCTLSISIVFFHYIKESTTVFLGKKNKNKNLLEFLSLKEIKEIIYLLLHLLYKLRYVYSIMVWLLQIQNTVIVSSLVFMSNFWVRLFIIAQVKSTLKRKFPSNYFSVISFTCEVLDEILVLNSGNRTLTG